MTEVPRPDQAALLSTGVVARILDLSQGGIRAMIDSHRLPEPQWMTQGLRVERVYTQEWLILALDRLHSDQIIAPDEMQSPFVPAGWGEFVLRFDSEDWKLAEIARTLAATEALWNLCNRAVGVPPESVAPISVKRMSSGSPLDLLIQVGPIGAGVSVAVGLLLLAVKNAGDLGGAIPKFFAEWHEQRARQVRGKTDLKRARLEAAEFESEASARLSEMKTRPRVSEIARHDPRELSALPEPETRPRRMFIDSDSQSPKAISSDSSGRPELGE
ncbi:hypothetical protein [Schumannella soli]|uniref:Uncharacterized protein n=1 Tax=Schumannella soli TaxID=2590779 RepID=A0A506XPA2_9MICO|nr:hypothetical protein [Schumannella soli]TPW74514.1 hypothetical protein FJ657_12990 [Schumannella soli]